MSDENQLREPRNANSGCKECTDLGEKEENGHMRVVPRRKLSWLAAGCAVGPSLHQSWVRRKAVGEGDCKKLNEGLLFKE